MKRDANRIDDTQSVAGFFSAQKLRSFPCWTFAPVVVVGITVLLVFGYVMIRGPVPFYYESLGTMLLAPVIYVRLLPAPYDYYLLMAFAANPLGCYLLCWVPVLLLVSAVSCALHSLRRGSLPAALTSLSLCVVVFGTYHFLQPLGFTFALR
ncbi:MAG: hypothetical protein ACOVMP_12020 [Chthoniobacterales bacterium]